MVTGGQASTFSRWGVFVSRGNGVSIRLDGVLISYGLTGFVMAISGSDVEHEI